MCVLQQTGSAHDLQTSWSSDACIKLNLMCVCACFFWLQRTGSAHGLWTCRRASSAARRRKLWTPLWQPGVWVFVIGRGGGGMCVSVACAHVPWPTPVYLISQMVGSTLTSTHLLFCLPELMRHVLFLSLTAASSRCPSSWLAWEMVLGRYVLWNTLLTWGAATCVEVYLLLHASIACKPILF